MARFSAALMDHFLAPHNAGKLDSPDFVGVAGVPGLGRFVVLYLQVRDRRITAARYECNGCGVTIACGSALTELVEGRTVEECRRLSEVDLITALEGVPEDKADRVPFAFAALRDALHQLGPPADLLETTAS